MQNESLFLGNCNSIIFNSFTDNFNFFSNNEVNILNDFSNNNNFIFVEEEPEEEYSKPLFDNFDNMPRFSIVETDERIINVNNDEKIKDKEKNFEIEKEENSIIIDNGKQDITPMENNENSQNTSDTKNTNTYDECFPFTSKNNINDICSRFKFSCTKYSLDNGKKKKVKKSRKFKSDFILRKIKSRFHKTLKNLLNKYLKEAGSKYLCGFFPQCFICNITKKYNSKYMEFTYKELLTTNFLEEIKDKKSYKNYDIDLKQIKNNINFVLYLEKNPKISEKSGFELIKNKKYKDILKQYFASSEFESSLIQLKNENEYPEYIIDYINTCKNYISYYQN